jgi:hypothetical protein
MESLLTTIVLWLSFILGMPPSFDHPSVEFVPPAKMAEVRFSRLSALRPDRPAAEAGRLAPPEAGQDVHAIYDDMTRTIYLPTDWSAARPADLSVLVHEMVHHLQRAAGQTFTCAQEREQDAYKAQREWLALFGRTMEQEFGIDGMTLLVRTRCPW